MANRISISGLVELSIYEGRTDENEKITILLAGDSHTYDYAETKYKDVTDAETFISDALEKSKDLKDIFIELPYCNRNEKPDLIPLTNYMANVQRKYIENFEWGKVKNTNIRAHYVDLRRNAPWDKELEELRAVVNIEFYKTKGMHKKSILKQYLAKLECNDRLYNKLSSILSTKSSIIEHIENTICLTKIPKQIDSMYSDTWRDELLKFVEKWKNNRVANENIEWKWLLWENIIECLYDEEMINDNIEEIYYALTAYFGIYMDIYTIARMFRTFKDEKGKYSKKPKKIVVYAGSFHTNRIATFLNKIKFRKVVTVCEKNADDNCVQLNKKYLPVFNNKTN